MLNIQDYGVNTTHIESEVLYIEKAHTTDKSYTLNIDGMLIRETSPTNNVYIKIEGNDLFYHVDNDKLYDVYQDLLSLENSMEYDNSKKETDSIKCNIGPLKELIPLSWLKPIIVLLHIGISKNWIENPNVDTLLSKTIKELEN